ncbi:hypothetical protein F4861DRAFT_551842 [Xylaria intraflava]|nr:hypothetical protein F4861DRAFT_551842 [Xylaria intraflava]
MKYPKNQLARSSGQNHPAARFPTLNALCSASSTVQAVRSTTDTERLRKIVEKNIGAFASAPHKQTTPFFNLLRSFSEAKSQARKNAEEKRRDTNTIKIRPDEDKNHPERVYNTLYDVVKKHAKCCCDPSSASKRRHWGRLELQANFRTDNNEVLFHTVFSKKAIIETVGIENVEWQHLKTLRKTRVVRFEDQKKDDDSAEDWVKLSNSISSKVKTTPEFCRLLSTDIGPASMDVSISDEALLVLKRVVKVEVDIADKESISLANILANDLLAPRNKLLLAYLLAKSVWQFYDSNFMSLRWTTETIQLFQEREGDDDDSDSGHCVDWTPYYAFAFDGVADRDSMERLQPGQFLHRYPRILALGAMLYDLGRKSHLSPSQRIHSPSESYSSLRESPTLENRINRMVSTIRVGLKKRHWPDIKMRNIQALEDYRSIVENCVSESLFRPNLEEKPRNNLMQDLQKTPGELEEELTVQDRRAILFKKVVAPLQQMLQSTGWVDESGNIRPHDVKRAITSSIEKRPVLQKPRPIGLVLSDSPQMPGTLTGGIHGTLASQGSVVH